MTILSFTEYLNKQKAQQSETINSELHTMILRYLVNNGVTPSDIPNLHLALGILKASIEEYFDQESELLPLLGLTISLQKEIDHLNGQRMI